MPDTSKTLVATVKIVKSFPFSINPVMTPFKKTEKSFSRSVAAYPIKSQVLKQTRTHTMKTLVICSGGLTLSRWLINAQENTLLGLISFDYGQRHKELDYAAKAATALGVSHDILDISNIGAQLSGSALTDEVDVPDGHYAEDTMKITVAPIEMPLCSLSPTGSPVHAAPMRWPRPFMAGIIISIPTAGRAY